jgi:putative transposase
VWVRNHHAGGWIQAPWTHLRTGPAPFGEQAWNHARQMLARRGHDRATEAEIARTAEELLDKAEHGPGRGKPAKRDQKVAGRDRAVSAAARPLPEPQPQPPPAWDDADDDEDAGQLAEVIPLGIFDAREEAKKWW